MIAAIEAVFRDGDTLYMFGFSRGAALARMVAAEMAKPKDDGTTRPNIHFLGLWDTVAAFANMYQFRGFAGLGQNSPIGLPADLDTSAKQIFDFTLHDNVENVLHLVAIDEVRKVFAAVPIMEPDPVSVEAIDERVQEMWMPGTHTDVGGGRSERALANIALNVMVDGANAVEQGLGLDLPDSFKETDESASVFDTNGLPERLRQFADLIEGTLRVVTTNVDLKIPMSEWLWGEREVRRHLGDDLTKPRIVPRIHSSVAEREAVGNLVASQGVVDDLRRAAGLG